MSIGDYYASTAAVIPVLALTKTASRAVATSYRTTTTPPPEEEQRSSRGQRKQQRQTFGYENRWWRIMHVLSFVAAAIGIALALYGAYTEEDGTLALCTAIMVIITAGFLLAGVGHEEYLRKRRHP
jgi:hypothetical protein